MTKKEFQHIGFRLRGHQRRDWRYQHLAAHHIPRKKTEAVALCCYFDRVGRTLTTGESHYGLIPVTRRSTQAEALILCCYGVEVRLVDEAGLGLCQRLRDTLPPEFTSPSRPSEATVAYAITASTRPGLSEVSGFLISCDGEAVFATGVEEELYWWLRRDIEQAVARRSPRLLFVHAGVVGWRGVGIVIPGYGSIGKTRLVAELVRRGATYYSDTFAVLDDQGRLHPYRGLLGLGIEGYDQNVRLIREDGSTEPLPIGLIVNGAYAPETVWRPDVVRGPLAVLPLTDATVLAREDATRMRQVAAQIAVGAVGLRGSRSEAKEVAALLLDLVDDALVSHALDAAGDNPGGLADELARVAKTRLRSPDGRTVPPPRHLQAARYVRLTDFLSPAERERLLQYVLSGENQVWEARVIGAEHPGALREEARQLSAFSTEHNDIWNLFDARLRAMLPFVWQQLDNPGFWYWVGRIEWQITAHDQVMASAPRVDVGSPQTSDPLISCVYSFHLLPKRFSGGELKLYDRWVMPLGSTCAGTYTALEPLDNSLVFFPSDTFHEFCPVEPETGALADRRFTLTIRFWEAEWLAQAGTLAAQAVGADSRPALPAPVARRRASSGSHTKHLVAVVVPAYRFPLSADDQIAIRHLRTHLGTFDRYMIGQQTPPAEFSDFARAPASANNYVDYISYSHLLMSEPFYRAFEDYQYILIYQLDCLVFSNALEAWCHKGYDYVGSPWLGRWHRFDSEQQEYSEDVVDALSTVGNGGFSLRKVDAALAVLTSAKRPLYDRLVQEQGEAPGLRLPEDQFWSFHAPTLVDDFRIPKAREALQFAFQGDPRYCYRQNGYRLPFGCHYWSWLDREFWEPFLLK